MAFQLDTSEPGYSPDPSSLVGSGVQTNSSQGKDVHTKMLTQWPFLSFLSAFSLLSCWNVMDLPHP